MCTHAKALPAILLLCGITLFASAQNFENSAAGLEPLYGGRISWGDLDSDADLDLIYSGFAAGGNAYHTRVYENSSGTFVLRTTSLPNLRNGEIALGDYDGDGDPDVLISGRGDAGNFSSLYTNNGSFAFSFHASFPGILNTSLAWADIDNDEDLDLVIAGVDDNTGTSNPFINKMFVYRNDGVGFVPLTNTNLPPCSQCAMDWADVNNDGNVDVAITTVLRNNEAYTEIYLNNGNNTFDLDEHQALPQLYNGDVQWGDFDRDGQMDLLVSGVRADGSILTEVYQNNAGTLQLMDFLDIDYVGENFQGGTRWVDYNNDGMLDIILSGRGGSIVELEYLFKGYINNGDSTFTEDQFGIEGISDSSLDFGDFDNDGDVDIVYMGQNSQGPATGILENKLRGGSFSINTKPLPPSLAGLSERFYRKQTYLSWTEGSDAQTPTEGLTYNFWLQQGATKIFVPTANRLTGYVTTSNPPNGHAQSILIPSLAEGNYTWGVQSIDGANAGSLFTASKAFYKLNGPEVVKGEILDETHVRLTWVDNSSAETSYRIERSTNPESGYVSIATPAANTTAYTDNFALAPETFYYYRIYAVNATTSSGYDSLQVLMPAAPENPYGQWIRAARIVLSWDDMSDSETGFEVERRLGSAATFTVVGTVSNDIQSFFDRGLSDGTNYVYRVRAKNEYGYSAYSSPVTITTNITPSGADLTKSGTEDEDVTFTIEEFNDKFADQNADDVFNSIFVAKLPARGVLRLGNNAVVAGQQILISNLDKLVYSPATDDNGLHTFDFYYSDGKDSSDVAYRVHTSLAAVNDAPVFSLPTTLELEEDFEATTLLPETSIPADEQLQMLAWSIAPAEVEGITVELDAETGALKLSPVENAFGKWTFTITANDGQNENSSHSVTVTVTVTEVNDAPVIAFIEDIAVEKAQPVPSITLMVTDADSPIEVIAFDATSDNQAVIKDSKLNIVGRILTMSPELKVGKAVITVQATDGISIGSREFSLEILTITSVERSTPGVDAYPNPVEQTLRITVGENFTPPFRIMLYDALGRMVFDQVSEAHDPQVDFTVFRAGIYILKVFSPKNDVLYQARISRK